MQLRYAPALTEAVVDLDLTRRAALGDRRWSEEARGVLEPIYQLPAERRPSAIESAYQYLFLKLEHDRPVTEALALFPEFATRLEKVAVTLPDRGEGCSPDREGRRLHVRLKADRFFDPDAPLFLRRELLHAIDMVDSTFGYRFEAQPGPDGEIVRDRYALFWNMAVDARLAERGLVSDEARGFRAKQFERLYQKFPVEARETIFNALWTGGRRTHAELLALARDPQKLLELGAALPPRESAPLPGTRCPLCSFPTYRWLLNGALSPVLPLIAADFPAWRSQQGVCERCFELYALRAGIW